MIDFFLVISKNMDPIRGQLASEVRALVAGSENVITESVNKLIHSRVCNIIYFLYVVSQHNAKKQSI